MKKWWRSKTLWINASVACFAAMEASTGLLKPYIGDGGYVLLLIALPTVNTILRFVSSEKLTK